MYFGWADAGLNPRMGVEYYEQVSDRMGPSTSNFFRLFMVPGMFHCDGGVGVSAFDAMTPLVRWVEKAVVPERIIGSRIIEGKTYLFTARARRIGVAGHRGPAGTRRYL